MHFDHLGAYADPQDSVNDKRNTRNREWRVRALMLLGGKCERCGFNDSRALQIDHVDGDGHFERPGGFKTRSMRTLSYIFTRALAGELQLLCANCNWIKRDERQEFRH